MTVVLLMTVDCFFTSCFSELLDVSLYRFATWVSGVGGRCFMTLECKSVLGVDLARRNGGGDEGRQIARTVGRLVRSSGRG